MEYDTVPPGSVIDTRCPLTFVRLVVLCIMAWTSCALPAGGQDTSVAWDEFAARYAFDFASREEAGGMSVEEQLEQLYVIHLAPMDLNTAGRDDLLQLPFIDAAAADSLLAFRERHGPFRSLGDLQFVRGLDYRAREWLPVFVCCAAPAASRPSVRELLTQGRWEVNGLLGVPLYRRAGNRSHSADELAEYPNRQYLGNGLSHTLRLNYSAAGRLDYGLKFDKDAGEPFARRGNRPYDEYAFYFALHPGGRWRDVVAGDYRVNVGEGLLLGNSFMVDKASVVAAYRPPVARVSPTLSSGGANLMRGLAATWTHGGWAWSAFASYRKTDANLDTAGRVTSLKTDGYHRTPLERSKRRNLGVTAAGGAAEYGQDDWRVGVAVTAMYYDRPLAPRSALYSRYYPRGHWLGGASAYYGVRLDRWASRGEVAVDRLVEDLPNAYLRSGEYIDLHQRMASKAGKPLVIEEFGYPRDHNNYSRQSTTGARDGYYSFIFNRLLESYRHQGILAGCNFWGWGGEAVADSTAWMPGADYMVDPPHEPQGWYSVFDEDYSTIQIIEQTVAALKP